MRRAVIVLAVFITALAFRLGGDGRIPPFDDAYHAKRIAWTAAHWPQVLTFDPDRGVGGAFCPWPPLYDWASGTLALVTGVDAVVWLPPIGFALLSAAVAWALFPAGALPAAVGGFGLAAAPYLIGVSGRGAIDHHWVEPFLLLAIVAARRRPMLLALSLAAALFVQTALIVACAIAFTGLFFFREEDTRGAARAFAAAALAVVVYRLLQPLPDGPWFLGWTHAALLTAAAVVLWLRGRWYALPLGAAVTLPFLPSIAAGTGFFRGDPWLRSITEFQPMLRNPSTIGTDVANLGGGAVVLVVGLLLARRAGNRKPETRNQKPETAAEEPQITNQRPKIRDQKSKGRRPFWFLPSGFWFDPRWVALFAVVYLVLALFSRRFLVPGIGLFVVAGALASASRDRMLAIVAALATLLPPAAYDAWIFTLRQSTNPYTEIRRLGAEIAPLPAGRVLAPWHVGHAIDVLGRHPVVIDNFGSMAGAALFANANDALLQRHPGSLALWCRARGVRYLALPAARHLPAAALCTGVDAAPWRDTPLSRSTVWWRLQHGEVIAGFSRVAEHVWEVAPAAEPSARSRRESRVVPRPALR